MYGMVAGAFLVLLAIAVTDLTMRYKWFRKIGYCKWRSLVESFKSLKIF